MVKGEGEGNTNNAVLFDKATWDKLVKEIPKAKLITPAIITERIKVNGALARQAIRILESQGQIERVGDAHAKMLVYTRKVAA